MTTRSRSLAVAGVAAITALSLVGCSSSGGSSTSPGAGGGGSTPHSSNGAAAGGASAAAGAGSLAALASSASAALGAGGSGLLAGATKLCAAVPTADVQKLAKTPVGAVDLGPGECNWAGGGITVDIYPGDTSKQYYNGGAVDNGTAISGIGDVAQWSAPVPGMTPPDLAAQKGSLTITVTVGLDVPDTSLAYTGSDPFFKIDSAATAQYVTEEGQLCTDIFAAAG